MPEDGAAAVASGTAPAVIESDAGASKDPVAPAANGTATASPSSTSTTVSIKNATKSLSKTSPKRPNYNVIHADSLPITIYHPPPLIPHNPISLLHHLYLFFFPPLVSHTPSYVAFFSPLTQSVHVTDPQMIRELWNRGFWGKGSLSRSEPEWFNMESRRLGFNDVPETSEEVKARRREQRKVKKKARAQKEKETIEAVLAEERKKRDEKDASAEEPKIVVDLEDEIKGAGVDKESQAMADLTASGVLTPPPSIASDADRESESPDAQQVEEEASDALQAAIAIAPTPPESIVPDKPATPPPPVKCVRFNDSVTIQASPERSEVEEEEEEAPTPPRRPENREHLQLTLQEAFFLHFALGVLEIRHADSTEAIPTPELLRLFRTYAHFPPSPLPRPNEPLNPDDPFLISYAVYHHFRSLGWVVRSGIKFGVDFMLYNRGVVFSHADFGVVVVPSYERWGAEKHNKAMKMKSWSWLHSITRVNAQVKKTVVFVYVDVPTVKEVDGWDKKGGIGFKGVLGRYGIKEVAMRRWVPGRNRD